MAAGRAAPRRSDAQRDPASRPLRPRVDRAKAGRWYRGAGTSRLMRGYELAPSRRRREITRHCDAPSRSASADPEPVEQDSGAGVRLLVVADGEEMGSMSSGLISGTQGAASTTARSARPSRWSPPAVPGRTPSSGASRRRRSRRPGGRRSRRPWRSARGAASRRRTGTTPTPGTSGATIRVRTAGFHATERRCGRTP